MAIFLLTFGIDNNGLQPSVIVAYGVSGSGKTHSIQSLMENWVSSLKSSVKKGENISVRLGVVENTGGQKPNDDMLTDLISRVNCECHSLSCAS